MKTMTERGVYELAPCVAFLSAMLGSTLYFTITGCIDNIRQ